jgi:hypothetical protein
MPTLQTCASAAARAVADVPGAIAATKHANAHARSPKLVTFLTSFVFISIISFSCFGLLDSSLLSCHFWPFTGVLRKIFGSLTQEVGFAALNR